MKNFETLEKVPGNIVVDESQPDWWQDKKNPDRHGIRILVLDENGNQTGVRQFKPNSEAIIAIDDTKDRYHITSMRDRIGEVLITVKRYIGDIPDGSEIIESGKEPTDGLGE